jgi:hypothetical protein
MMMPISMLRQARGKVILTKVLIMEAPRLRETFSSLAEMATKAFSRAWVQHFYGKKCITTAIYLF